MLRYLTYIGFENVCPSMAIWYLIILCLTLCFRFDFSENHASICSGSHPEFRAEAQWQEQV
jgi:hypothetical protein